MQAPRHSTGTAHGPSPERRGLGLGLMLLAGLMSGAAFVALIHAPLPEEVVLASLGHEATAGAIGRPATR